MIATALKNCNEQTGRACFKNPFLSIKFFVCCHALLQLSQLLVSGYLKSSISTIEKRFGLSSQMSGLVASFNEIGNVALIVFVSYFGSRVHRPRVIGCGALLVCIAGFVMSLPHFMVGPYEYDQSIASVYSNLTDICQPDSGSKTLSNSTCAAQSMRGDTHVLSFLFIGQFLLGVGGVPIQPFGISYIDDFASKSNSPLYIGILFAVTFMGSGVAFLLGSAMLRYYVDIDKMAAVDIVLTPKDPRWVGAWWMGFLVTGSVVGLSALPYFFFPRTMQKEGTEKETDSQPRNDIISESKPNPEIFGNLSLIDFIKLFPKVLLKNLRNPVCLLVILAQVNLSAMVTGIAIFMAKFLEQQFSITASMANLILGAVNIPGAMAGIIVGGAIMKKFQMSLKQCGAMCVIGMVLCLIIALPIIFLGCPTKTFFAPGHVPGGSEEIGHNISKCNGKCNCPDTAYNPICGHDGIEYISPCYAGCEAVILDFSENKVVNYTKCSCIPHSGGEGSATAGSCSTGCFHLLLPFIVFSCLAGFIASTTHTPSFIIILRSVQQQDKSLVVGIQFMLMRVLAWMPCPVLYGRIIDSTCLLWERKCGKNASCRYYDNTLFRQRYLGLQLAFEVGAFVSFLIVFLVLRRQEREAAKKCNPEDQALTLKMGGDQEKKV
ncbi:solute carrier organic anion transporter family member 2B1 [Ambystoma mexicanum]|uniref:solute carrier organic anion transporter family member 2B1 n=1 Tax=Ambystoma mexicanum TaxID=8296 RepID=UPI0037E96995